MRVLDCRLMADIDPDGGGSLDWEEFAALMAHALYSTGEVDPNKQIMASAGKVRMPLERNKEEGDFLFPCMR